MVSNWRRQSIGNDQSHVELLFGSKRQGEPRQPSSTNTTNPREIVGCMVPL